VPTPREIVRLQFPWNLPSHLQTNPAYDLMRTHDNYRLELPARHPGE
jgi:hypothetical protein